MIELSQHAWSEGITYTDTVILDVRTPEEVAQGIIPRAVHCNIYDGARFIDFLETLDRTKHYYVYCRVGARSGQACRVMDTMGFNHTYNLTGGIMNWQGPVVQPKT